MKVHCSSPVTMVKLEDLRPHPKNRNAHPPEQIKRLAEILKYQGVRYPIKVSALSGFITSGHGRLEAAKLNGWTEFPCQLQQYDDEDQEYADLVADNATASWSELQLPMINIDLADLSPDFNLDMLGIKDFVLEPADKNSSGTGSGFQTLSDRFIVPPFSVLDARQGYWQDRKREWLALGIKSELGRGGGG